VELRPLPAEAPLRAELVEIALLPALTPVPRVEAPPRPAARRGRKELPDRASIRRGWAWLK